MPSGRRLVVRVSIAHIRSMNTAIESNNKEEFEKIAHQQAMLGGLSANGFCHGVGRNKSRSCDLLNHRYLVLAGFDCFDGHCDNAGGTVRQDNTHFPVASRIGNQP